MKTFDISGMGGSYEATCQAMLFAGVKWLKNHPEFSFKGYKSFKGIFGIVIPPDTDLSNELEKVLLDAARGDSTGAMHQAVLSHLAFIHKQGYVAWLEEAKKNGKKIIEVNEAEVEKQVLKLQVKPYIEGGNMEKQEKQKLVDAHWEYIGGILAFFTHEGLKSSELYEFTEYIYKTAMLHGIKHSREEK